MPGPRHGTTPPPYELATTLYNSTRCLKTFSRFLLLLRMPGFTTATLPSNSAIFACPSAIKTLIRMETGLPLIQPG